MDDTIRRYLERALELADQRDDALQEADLAQIARELGLDDADLARIAAEVEDSLTRGRGFAERQMWSDAIRELRDAATLAPTRSEITLALAHALIERGEAKDRTEAEQLARHVVATNPHHDQAYELLARLSQPARPRADRTALMTVLIIASAIGGAVSYYATLPSPNEPAPGTATTRPAVVAASPATAPHAVTTGEVDLPVEWSGGDDALRFTARKSRLANYEARSFYTLWGQIEVVEDIELERLAIDVKQLDANGEVVVAANRDALASHEAVHRKGDRVLFALLLDGQPATKRVIVSPGLLEKRAASGPYAQSSAVEPVWTVKPPEHLKVQIRERHASFKTGILPDRGTFEATWEIENRGTVPIRELTMMANLYDAGGNKVDARKKIVTYSSHPAIEPGHILIENTIAILQTTEFGRYELEIIEIE